MNGSIDAGLDHVGELRKDGSDAGGGLNDPDECDIFNSGTAFEVFVDDVLDCGKGECDTTSTCNEDCAGVGVEHGVTRATIGTFHHDQGVPSNSSFGESTRPSHVEELVGPVA